MFPLIVLLLSASAFAQTGAINAISGVVDMHTLTHTAPMIVVADTASLPSSGCIVGEQAVVTSAPTGQQIYENSSTSCNWTQQAIGTTPTPGYSPNQGVTGCGVEYISGLTFNVGQCTFTIGGQTWTAPATMVTSAAADPANPRIDSIVAQITTTAGVGIITILQGTPAATPVVPVVDFSVEIELTHYTILAMGTTPSGVTSTLLYDEDTGGPGEWTATCSANLNCASTNNPYHLTKDIEATAAVLTNNFTLVKPSAGTLDPSTVGSLTFYIRSKGQWATGNAGANAARSLALFWLNGSTQEGVQVILRDGAFSFLSSNTTTYQQINIPIGIFAVPLGTLVTTLKVAVVGPTGTASIGFYIDEVTLQSGTPPPPPPVAPTPFACATFVMNGQGSVLTTGDLNVFPTSVRAGTIVRIDTSGNPSGSATMNIWKRALGIPTSANLISASAPATLASSALNQNGSLIGWSLSVAVGDVWGATLVTATTVTSLTVQIWCQ